MGAAYYFRADSIASRDDGANFDAQSAYTLAIETASFDVVRGLPTARPSYAPTIPPTYAPTIEATTARPTHPPPTAKPVAAPTTRPDAATWYKNGDTAKDCAWVSRLADPRCDVKGWDDTWAYEACLTACAGWA